MNELQDEIDNIVDHLRDTGYTEEEIYIIGEGVREQSGIISYDIEDLTGEELLKGWKPEGEPN